MRYKKAILLVLLANASHAFAATYYVKPNGSDSSNGLSHATAWKSVNKVNNFSFNSGDDVYFLSGGSWKSQLVVDWNGTANNRVTIGSYYMSNGTEKKGIKTGETRPTLIGGYPLLNVTGAIPSSNWSAMIQVNANYVTIKNLRVEKSSGSGIVLNNDQHHAIFENNEVDVTAGSSMIFARRSHSNVMRNNRMRACATSWHEGTWVTKPHPICNGAVGSRDNLIENNHISDNFGEGIVAFAPGADNNIIRGNTVQVIRAPGIYVDNGANNLVENNLVVGTTHSKYPKGGTAYGLNVEDYQNMNDATGNIFRNNLAANIKVCFWMGMEPAAISKGYKLGGKFIGNTCIGARDSIKHYDTAQEIQEFEVSNNIFYGILNSSNSCNFPTTSKVIFKNNLWQEQPADTDCRSNGDVIGNPKLSKSTGWTDITVSSGIVPTESDFTPQSSSTVFGSGIPLSYMNKDYFGNTRPSNPAIGAIDTPSTTASSEPTIPQPQGLVMTIFQ